MLAASPSVPRSWSGHYRFVVATRPARPPRVLCGAHTDAGLVVDPVHQCRYLRRGTRRQSHCQDHDRDDLLHDLPFHESRWDGEVRTNSADDRTNSPAHNVCAISGRSRTAGLSRLARFRVRQLAHDQGEVGGATGDDAAGARSFVAKSSLLRQYRVEHSDETATRERRRVARENRAHAPASPPRTPPQR
jgi:hypothetical protein